MMASPKVFYERTQREPLGKMHDMLANITRRHPQAEGRRGSQASQIEWPIFLVILSKQSERLGKNLF